MAVELFQPLRPRPTAVAACAEALRVAVLRGEVVEGERLPPERVLAERLGVNRTTLRAALRELEAAGLVRVRQGSGYVVLGWRASGGPTLLPDLAMAARARGELLEVCADLLEVRRRLAVAVLERLERRPLAESELSNLEARIARFAELAARPSSSIDELIAADVGILQALVALSGSAVLGLFLNPVLSVLGGLPELGAAIYARPTDNASAYGALVSALRAGGVHVSALVAVLEERDRETLGRLEATLGQGSTRRGGEAG